MRNCQVSSVDWYKVYERLAIRFKEKLARHGNKTNNIHDTVRIYLINVCKSAALSDMFTFTKLILNEKVHFLCMDLCNNLFF